MWLQCFYAKYDFKFQKLTINNKDGVGGTEWVHRSEEIRVFHKNLFISLENNGDNM